MSAAPGAFGAPLFHPLRPWLDGMPPRPDTAALAALAARAGLRTAGGLPLRFTPPRDDGLAYETRIWTRGEVETRPDNWHDFFNGLVWLAFPRAKAALNARHVRAAAGAAGRGANRDAMTHFDECGIVVAGHRPELFELIRQFRWRELFWERRRELAGSLRCFVFGHATYEQLLAPFRGLTAKAVFYEVAPGWLDNPPARCRAEVDGFLAGQLGAGRYAAPRELQPLPLMGLPGMTPDNEQAAYYDDTWQFRPGRRGAPVVPAVTGAC